MFSITKQALRTADGSNDTPASKAEARSGDDTILLHMEVTKLRLRQLVAEQERLTRSEISTWRNFESVGNLCAEMLRYCLPLRFLKRHQSISWTMPPAGHCRAVVVMAAGLLISIGTRLNTKQSSQATLAHKKLQKSIHAAVDSIYASTKSLFPEEVNVVEVYSSTLRLRDTAVSAIFAMWPLYAATITCYVGSDRHGHIGDLLWRIGKVAKLPKAKILVSRSSIGS